MKFTSLQTTLGIANLRFWQFSHKHQKLGVLKETGQILNYCIATRCVCDVLSK